MSIAFVPPLNGVASLISIFRFGLLDLRPFREAAEKNDSLLGRSTLGIEVTCPALANRCGLGNIDPQHLGKRKDLSAIEVAMTAPLPPPSSRLVTIRPDADAYGAMALLCLRAGGVSLTPELLVRVGIIAREDRFDKEAWRGVRPLPATAQDIDEVGRGEQGHGALVGGLAQPGGSIDQGVAAVLAWLAAGELPPHWAERADSAAELLFKALEARKVTVHLHASGRIALVRGAAPGALRLGYRLAPVVVAVDERPTGDLGATHRRVAVAQWSEGHADLRSVATQLSALEHGWGGSSTIIGSPQGRATQLPVETVIETLLEHMA